MTYWATLWYAGSVVITLGSEGQTLKRLQHAGAGDDVRHCHCLYGS